MRTLRSLLLAGGAALALAMPAYAKEQPKPQPPPDCPKSDAAWTSAWPSLWSSHAAFADFDRIAAMNRRMAAMIRRMNELERIARSEMATGSASTLVGGAPRGFCGQSVEITQVGDDPPRVVRRSWGDCSQAGATQTSAPDKLDAASII